MDEDELQANECEEWGDLLAELRWFKRVTEDDDTNVYSRAIDRIEKLEAENARLRRGKSLGQLHSALNDAERTESAPPSPVVPDER